MKRLRDPKKTPRACGAYVGYVGYASMLACVKRPHTAAEVADRLGIGRQTARELMKQFHVLRQVHRVGWSIALHGFDQPVYRIGDGPDVPARMTRSGKPMPHADAKPRVTRRVAKFGEVMRALEIPLSLPALEAEAPVHGSSLRRLVDHMLSPGVRLIYVADYEQRRGNPTRLLAYGPDKPDAPRPEPMGPSARKALHSRVKHDVALPRWDATIVALKRNAGFQVSRAHGTRSGASDAGDD